MSLLSFIASATFGATAIWCESSLLDVYPATERPAGAVDSVRLYAAPGEYESFQLCLRGDRKGSDAIRVEAGRLDDEIDAPELFRVGYLSRGAGRLRPDPLMPNAPFDLPARETRAVWVTYHVPETARPGVHQGFIDIYRDNGRKWALAVAIEVFDIPLRDSPRLPAVFALGRSSVRTFYGVRDEALSSWRRHYDAFAPFPFVYAPFDVPHAAGLTPETAADHLTYAATSASMPFLVPYFMEVRSAPPGAPFEGAVTVGAAGVGGTWDGRVRVPVLALGGRPSWLDATALVAALQARHAALDPLLVSPLHPFFEDAANVWATPVGSYHPVAFARLREGVSLEAARAPRVERMAASVNPAAAHDAYDGSFFTEWTTAPATGESMLEFQFPQRIETRAFRIAWTPGHEPRALRVQTSWDGDQFSMADVAREDHAAVMPYDHSWSEVRFTFSKQFTAMRLLVTPRAANTAVSIIECEFEDEPVVSEAKQRTGQELWFALDPTAFPSLAIRAHAVEPRLLPWLCWTRRADGIVGGALCDWPRAWAAAVAEAAVIWPQVEEDHSALFYPGPEMPLPSIRAQRLRDGLEDYGYAVASGRHGMADPATPTAVDLLQVARGPEELAAIAESIQKDRIAIGRGITREESKRQP